MYDFAKETHFDIRGPGNKSTRDGTLGKLFKSLAVMASGISNTNFLPSNADELCDKVNLLLQEKQAGNNSNIFN